MLINGKIFEILNFDDINSLVSLKGWLKASLTTFDEDENISDNQLNIFIDYLRNKCKEQRIEDKRKWLDKLDSLSTWLENPRRGNIANDKEGEND